MSQIIWNSKSYQKFDIEQAKEYGIIANEVFAPIYPVIAQQIVDRCQVTSGLCIDVGSGAANLSIALAGITSLNIYAMDFSRHIHEIARKNIEREGFDSQVIPVVGDVHRMPFYDGVASLIVSRGSMRFWRNKPAAFREFKRVLRPGGKGYVGGGIGDPRLDEQINREMIRQGMDRQGNRKFKSGKRDIALLKVVMEKAGYCRYEIINDASGFWVCFEKEEERR